MQQVMGSDLDGIFTESHIKVYVSGFVSLRHFYVKCHAQ